MIIVFSREKDLPFALRDTFLGHASSVKSVKFVPGDRAFASVGGTTIRFWSAADSTLLRSYDRETGMGLEAIAFSPDGCHSAMDESMPALAWLGHRICLDRAS